MPRKVSYPPPPTIRNARLHVSFAELGLREQHDFWPVHAGNIWRLRYFEHTTAEQQVRGDKLANKLLN